MSDVFNHLAAAFSTSFQAVPLIDGYQITCADGRLIGEIHRGQYNDGTDYCWALSYLGDDLMARKKFLSEYAAQAWLVSESLENCENA